MVAVTKEPRADDPEVATTIIGNKASEVVRESFENQSRAHHDQDMLSIDA